MKEYAIKIELQEHGSPHAHCLLWVNGAPPLIDVDSDEDVCSFIDRYISGRIPNESLETSYMAKIVKQYRTHSHSSYCRCNHSCQFGFPKAPSQHTLICREPENVEERDTILKHACDILKKVYEIVDKTPDKITLRSLRTNVNTSRYIS